MVNSCQLLVDFSINVIGHFFRPFSGVFREVVDLMDVWSEGLKRNPASIFSAAGGSEAPCDEV